MSNKASQNEGVENPMKTKIVVNRSSREYCRVADMMPMGMAMRSTSPSESRLIVSVIGRHSRILSLTLRPSAKAVPKSRVTNLWSQVAYCL